MLPDRVSNPGPLTYESGVLPIALRGPAYTFVPAPGEAISKFTSIGSVVLQENMCKVVEIRGASVKSHRMTYEISLQSALWLWRGGCLNC